MTAQAVAYELESCGGDGSAGGQTAEGGPRSACVRNLPVRGVSRVAPGEYATTSGAGSVPGDKMPEKAGEVDAASIAGNCGQ